MEGEEKPEKEGQIAKEKKLLEDKKRAKAYLKSWVEKLDLSLARNFAQDNFSLAAHDAKQMAAVLEVLGQIDLS